MQDDAPPDALGYVAVHLPEQRSWQGFFVLPQAVERGKDLIAAARATAGSIADGPAFPGIAPQDQAVVGALSGALARLYMSSIASPLQPDRAIAIQSAVAAMTCALHLLTAAKWLLVTGWRDPDDPRGMRSEIEALGVEGLSEAREAFNAAIARKQTAWSAVGDFTELVGGSVKPRQNRGT